MSGNHEDIAKIMNLTKLMSFKIAQLSPEPKIMAQLEKLDYLNQDFGNFIFEYKAQAEKIAPLRQKIANLEKELSEYRNSIDLKVKKTIQDLEKNLEIASEDLVLANNKISELNQSVNKLTLENQKLNNKLQREWKSTQDIRKELQKEREIREDLKARINELKRTLRRLQRRLSRGGRLFGIHIPVERIEDTEITTKGNHQEQIEQMKFELQKRLDKITELEMKNRDLKNQLIKSPAKDLQLQIQTLQKELDSKTGKIATFEAERTKLEQQIRVLENRITDLQVNYQEQTKVINDKEKRIKDLENTMRLGIHEKSTRDLVIDLQEKNKKLQSEIRQKDIDLKNLDKNAFFYKQQLDVVKRQVQTLYAQNRELVTKLQHGGTISSADLQREVDLFDGSSKFDQEMREQQHRLKRLEDMNKSLEQEISDLRYMIHAKDAKLEEMHDMMNQLKVVLAKAKIQVGPKGKKKKK
ncbi:MAG: hypothetical protein ACTSO9_05610 [Candidatus Helarchaeota archaeon]